MPTVVIRSLPGRVGFLLLALGGLAVLVTVLRSDGAASLVPLLGWGVLVGLAVWTLWWAPEIVLSDERLRVRNAWRTHDVAWGEVSGCSTRWSLVIVLRGGRTVTAAAAQRAGGLSTSWRRRQELREREMTTGRTVGGSVVPETLTHQGVHEEYLSPGAGRFRTSLDADGAGALIEAYAERWAVHERVRAHGHRREQRPERRDESGRDHLGGRGQGPEEVHAPARPSRAASGAPVVSSLNVVPVVTAAVGVALVLVSLW
ncbi:MULTISPECIES: hypothetical protein [Actinomyces]|uniref:PH domain-containing protein n=1 Tax=Actinomyces respiraculi TaxID=2744574 RepID=A0A7T0PXE0_9ACTO|nr:MULTISPECIES: hypothetical protein [Actinomyces]QPL05735.1 hypothetical protein ID810_01740 [Actinomyces respiraculi]